MSTDKIRSEFEKFQLSKYHPSVLEFIDGRYVRGVVNDEFAMYYHGWQAALSQSEPQVSQPVAEICSGFALHWVGSGAIAPIIEKHNLKVGDNLFSSPPDYEALKAQLVRSEADNTRLQSQYDEMRLKCSRRPAVAETKR